MLSVLEKKFTYNRSIIFQIHLRKKTAIKNWILLVNACKTAVPEVVTLKIAVASVPLMRNILLYLMRDLCHKAEYWKVCA